MDDGVPCTVSGYDIFQSFASSIWNNKDSTFTRNFFEESYKPYLSVRPPYELVNVVLLTYIPR